MKSVLVALSALAILAVAPAAKADGLAPKDFKPADYTVFVDKPTGYVFIRTPYGWKFVRKIESPALAEQAVQLQFALNDKR